MAEGREERELDLILKRKMERYLKKMTRGKGEEKSKEEERERRELILSRILTPEALSHLEEIKRTKPEIGKRIEEAILALFFKGTIVRRVTLRDLAYVERRLSGRRGEIRIESKGELLSFRDFIKKRISENEEG